MKLKEISSKAGSISDYLGYIILMFGYYIVFHGYALVVPETSGAAFQWVSWGFKLMVGPIIYAIVYGGIYQRQTIQDELERKSVVSYIRNIVLRYITANLLTIVIWLIAVVIAGDEAMNSNGGNRFFAIVSATTSTLLLFWYSAMVVEPKLFRSLIHAIKTLLFNPVALVIGILWTIVCVVDSLFFDFNSGPVPLAINLARSGVFAVVKVFAAMYILVIYKNAWGGLAEPSSSRPGETLAKVGLGFSFLSFLPLVHLVALILGFVSLKRSHRFILKAGIACCVGGFFTILYALLIMGYFAGQTGNSRLPGYSFLADSNSEIQPYVDLLEQGATEDVQAQIGDFSADKASRDWTIDTALALAKYQDNDMDGALENFYNALQKKPERSEFYFYYGLALIDTDNTEMAEEKFQLALEHDPKLEIAEQYVGLVQNMYQPTVITSALMYLLILLFLFSVHEFGHAFAAWKLGDDTAKNQGRLTLNPIAHIDLIGSIIIPAMLLFQQSDVLFGWARPVPVDTSKLKNPDKDHMVVSFAGPAVNLIVAMVSMIVLLSVVLLTRLVWPETLSLNLVDPFLGTSMIGPSLSKWILVFIVFLKKLFYTSLILGFLNLLPIPPLDGSWILSGFLPEGLRGIFDYGRRFSFVLFILLAATPVLDYVLSIPISIAWIGLDWIVSVIGFS